MLKNDIWSVLFLILATDTLPNMELPLVVALLIGFSIRISFNWGKNILTWKDALMRLTYAFGIFYLMVLTGFKYEQTVYPVVSTAILGFMSMEIINQAEVLILNGIKNYLRNIIDNLKAKE